MDMSFKCMECGRKFKTARAAEKAAWDGCPGCGGADINMDPDPTPSTVPGWAEPGAFSMTKPKGA